MNNNYFIRHHQASSSGFGEFAESHFLWLMRGDKEPGITDEYDPRGRTFRYCHVAERGEDILFDKICYKALPGGIISHEFDNYDRFKSLMTGVCSFLNSGQSLGNKKGHFYISEYCYAEGRGRRKTYTLNLIKSDERRNNETREDSGGFINKSTGDIHLFEFYCFSYKTRNSKKKIMQQICNALNRGVIEF